MRGRTRILEFRREGAFSFRRALHIKKGVAIGMVAGYDDSKQLSKPKGSSNSG